MTISSRNALILLLAALVLGLAGCAPTETPVVIETKVASPSSSTQTPAPTATPILTDTPVPTSTPTPTPAQLSPSAIYHQISPALAYIDTPIASGSGFLIENGYVLTNAHVVWPYATVRVVFPDGSEFKEAPVVGWNMMVDVAVIGPLDVDISPLTPVDGESLDIGSDVYLIGYPGEVETFPRPTITRGLITRIREWKEGEVTYFQTDAAIAGGQSGGVLISDQGEVIGISGFTFTESGAFGLVASASDIMPHVQAILNGEDTNEDRLKPVSRKIVGKRKAGVVVDGFWNRDVFLLWPPFGDVSTLELVGGDNLDMTLIDAGGLKPDVLSASSSGLSQGVEYEPLSDAPHFLVLTSNNRKQGNGALFSSTPLKPFIDPDDAYNDELLGKTYRGALDYPGDVDFYPIALKKDQTIHVRVDSVMIDPAVALVREGATGEKGDMLAMDDDSGGGLFGMDSEFSFRSPDDTRYIIVVMGADAFDLEVGGYFLTVEPYAEGAPTPVVITPTPTPVVTDAGKMAVYEHVFKPRFSVQYPADWDALDEEEDWACEDALACFGSEWSAVYFYLLPDDGDASLTQIPMVSLLDWLPLEFERVKLVQKQRVTNSNGLEFRWAHVRDRESGAHAWIALTTCEDIPIVSIFTLWDKASYDGGVPAFNKMVMESIDSFTCTR